MGVTQAEAAVGTLLGAIDVDGGATLEQTRLIDAVARAVVGVDPADVRPLDPASAAAAVSDEGVRHHLTLALVVLELVRHPPSVALASSVQSYLRAFGIDEAAQALAADYVRMDREHLAADYARLASTPTIEPGLVGETDDEVVAALSELGSCPPGSVGRAFHDFYVERGLALPGAPGGGGPSLATHDFTHVLTGIGTSAVGEVSLQGFLTASSDGRHFSGLLASLSLYEVGMLPFLDIQPTIGVLDRPGAAEAFADALRRGAECGIDLADLDHLAMADRPLADVRDELGITLP